jgi:hypothetical protein
MTTVRFCCLCSECGCADSCAPDSEICPACASGDHMEDPDRGPDDGPAAVCPDHGPACPGIGLCAYMDGESDDAG